jgi:hypothetical protein
VSRLKQLRLLARPAIFVEFAEAVPGCPPPIWSDGGRAGSAPLLTVSCAVNGRCEEIAEAAPGGAPIAQRCSFTTWSKKISGQKKARHSAGLKHN